MKPAFIEAYFLCGGLRQGTRSSDKCEYVTFPFESRDLMDVTMPNSDIYASEGRGAAGNSFCGDIPVSCTNTFQDDVQLMTDCSTIRGRNYSGYDTNLSTVSNVSFR